MRTMVGGLGGLAAVAVICGGLTLWAPAASAQGAYNWTGFYLGANAGGASKKQSTRLSVENDNPNNYFAPAVIPDVEDQGSFDLDNSGFTGGVQGGYNRQSGRLVWGVELDFNWFDLTTRHGGAFQYRTNNAPFVLTAKESTDWMLTARPRVGWALDRWLLYLTGGIAASHSEFEQTFSEPPFTPSPQKAEASKTRVGWTVGSGLEFAFARRWSARVEYLYSRFGETEVVGRLGGANGASAAAGFVDGAKFTNTLSPLELHLFRGGVNFHFK
jgi:outer membrane immunogenic protein